MAFDPAVCAEHDHELVPRIPPAISRGGNYVIATLILGHTPSRNAPALEFAARRPESEVDLTLRRRPIGDKGQ
jgi:hypothetical protein